MSAASNSSSFAVHLMGGHKMSHNNSGMEAEQRMRSLTNVARAIMLKRCLALQAGPEGADCMKLIVNVYACPGSSFVVHLMGAH